MSASGAAQTTPAVDLIDGAFPWSPNRRLRWIDFAGRPDITSPAVALSVFHVAYDTPCRAGRFHPSVVTRFLPRASWVNGARLSPAASAQVLQHEQSHFDLSEVLARQALAELRALDAPCALTNDQMQPLLAGFGRRDAEMQQQYDHDTGHGTDVHRQREWTARIDRWLLDKSF
jgi:hypothetical protein